MADELFPLESAGHEIDEEILHRAYSENELLTDRGEGCDRVTFDVPDGPVLDGGFAVKLAIKLAIKLAVKLVIGWAVRGDDVRVAIVVSPRHHCFLLRSHRSVAGNCSGKPMPMVIAY